jgi:Intracellular proteinase inhibitor
MSSRLAISLLCAGAIGIACTARPHADEAVITPASAQPVDGHPKIKSFLDIQRRDGQVRFALHVVNTGHKRIEIDFPSGQAYDFVVLDSVGRTVWRWARGRMFTQPTQIKYLGGGEEFAVAENWKNPPGPGTYTDVATLTSTNFPVGERTTFRVQ